MIVKIWLMSIILLSVVLGGISYLISKNKRKVVSSGWENEVNYGFDKMKIENPVSDIVSEFALRKRGSWRLAQDRVIGNNSFFIQRDIEYRKML